MKSSCTLFNEQQSELLRNNGVHELPLCKCQPPFVWGAIGPVSTAEQSPTCFFPYLLQVIPEYLCFYEKNKQTARHLSKGDRFIFFENETLIARSQHEHLAISLRS